MKNKLIKKTEEAMKKQKKSKLSGLQRAQFKREREALVGSIITQEGDFCGALVKEHVRGSQYVVVMSGGMEVYASHKKRAESLVGVSQDGWSMWRNAAGA